MRSAQRIAVAMAAPAATAALLSVGAARAAHAQIDTFSAWASSGGGGIRPFGTPNTSTYGETFVAGPASLLNSFTFALQSDSPFAFRGYVMAWDGLKATGPVLFASGDITTSGTSTVFTDYTVNTGGIALTPGQKYVAFFSTSQASNSGGGTSSMAGNFHNFDPNGEFVFDNNGTDFSRLTSSTWDGNSSLFFTIANTADVAFRADFSAGPAPVPEPGIVATALTMLGGTGLGLLRGGRRRRP